MRALPSFACVNVDCTLSGVRSQRGCEGRYKCQGCGEVLKMVDDGAEKPAVRYPSDLNREHKGDHHERQ